MTNLPWVVLSTDTNKTTNRQSAMYVDWVDTTIEKLINVQRLHKYQVRFSIEMTVRDNDCKLQNKD
jgi:hypothetical protein